MDIYLLIDGDQKGPYSEEQVRQSLAEGSLPGDLPAWREGLTERVMSESTHQVVITGAQGNHQPLEREERRTFLTRFNHLNVPLRDVGLYCECILTQLRAITESMEILSKSLERAFGYPVLHRLSMPNQGFA